MKVEAVDDGEELIGHELCIRVLLVVEEANELGLLDESTHRSCKANDCLRYGQVMKRLKSHGERLGQSHVGKERQKALHTHRRACFQGGDIVVFMTMRGLEWVGGLI